MDEDKDFVVVTVSGDDRPGILAALTKILVDGNVDVVDVEQATLQDFLGLSFLLDMSRARGSKDSVLKDIDFLKEQDDQAEHALNEAEATRQQHRSRLR